MFNCELSPHRGKTPRRLGKGAGQRLTIERRASEAGNRREEGFSLLELAIYSALLLVLGASLVTIILTAMRTTAENGGISKVQERNRTAIFRIERELRRSISGTPTVGDGGSSLSFASTAGFDGTVPVAGPGVRFLFRAAAGETWNGADDNGDGTVDEGELVRSDLSTGVDTIVSSAVDLNGSGFVENGAGVTINLASTGSLDRRFGSFSVSNSLTVYPRN